MTDNIVEIKGHKYRYEYVDGQTVYIGPVGNAPALSEEEFNVVVTTFGGGIHLPELDRNIMSQDLKRTWEEEVYKNAVTLAMAGNHIELVEQYGFNLNHVEDEAPIMSTWGTIRDVMLEQIEDLGIPTNQRGEYEARSIAVLLLSSKFQDEVFQTAYWKNRKAFNRWGDEQTRQMISIMAEESVVTMANKTTMDIISQSISFG